MAVAPVYIADTFSRSASSTWGVTDSGDTWLGESSIHSTDGVAGKITLAANAAYGTVYIDAANQSESEILMKVKWTSTTTFPLTDFGPVLRRTASNTFYLLTLQGNYSEIAIQTYVNGSRVELQRASTTINKDIYYWVRFKGTTTNLYGKIWAEGTAEPSSWTVSSGLYDGPNPPGGGDPGVFWKGTTNAYNVFVDTFYYYNLDPDEHPPLPISDTFERAVHAGWGVSNSGHAWEGHFADDVKSYDNPHLGSVEDPGDGYGEYLINVAEKRVGFLGQSTSGDREALMAFSVNSTAGNTWMRLGIRGTLTQSGGESYGHGYALEAKTGDTAIRIVEKSTFNGAWATLATSGAITALTTGKYWMRFQIVGTTLKGRIWLDGAGEPGTWDVTVSDSSFTTGRLWVEIEQTVTTTRTCRIYSITDDVPTPASNVHTTMGSWSLVTATDTTLAMRFTFTNDIDDDNSATVDYRVSGTTAWTSFGAATRNDANSRFEFTLTGLTPGTAYNIRITVTDPDTVVGTNPSTTTQSTLLTGLDTGVLSVTAIAATTATLKATYTNDSDNDSTCTLDYRTLSGRTNFVSDPFSDANGTQLQDHDPQVGTGWARHSSSMGTAQGIISSNRLYCASVASNDRIIYYVNDSSANNYYEVQADLFIAALGIVGEAGVIARSSTSAHTHYVAQYDMAQARWELNSIVSGTTTTLAFLNETLTVGNTYTIKLVVNDDYKKMYVNDVLILQSTDNTITSAGRVGIRMRGPENGTPSNFILLDNFSANHLTTTSSWTGSGAMTADRPNKWFTRNLTTLSQDTIYEFRATYADADALRGVNPLTTTGMTIGQAVALSSIGVATRQTSATIDVLYLYDSNNNSTLSVQYRSTKELLWTTVESSAVSVDRIAKKFSAVVAGLKPSTTYEARVTISDVNGIIEGLPSTLTTLFTTTVPIANVDVSTKHYLWKVYDSVGNYITTWRDAGEPEFAWHENGGVTDLSVRLPRKVSEINNPLSGISQQNRVDIICVDPSSNGFGTNLLEDTEFTQGSWTLGGNATISSTGGPDGTSALKLTATSTELATLSSPIIISASAPFVVESLAVSKGARLQMYVEAYNTNDVNIDQSSTVAETVGTEWQLLRLVYTPPLETSYIRVGFKNKGAGTMYADKVTVKAKENLIYRGRIESYTPTIEQESEYIEVEILGLISQLSDDYITFLQYVTIQPNKDATAVPPRPNNGATDPSEMLKQVIDLARNQNPRFDLYYTPTSIRNTGTLMEYTFRDQQVRACFDKIRSLCPAGWHYFVEPDGLVVLRGPEHALTYKLRIGVEILSFSVEKSIRNLKNHVRVKGRQDEDNSESDGHGSIEYTAFDQASIDRYGKRMVIIRDSNITDPETAELVGNGRLEEFNKEEQRALCHVPDEKSLVYTSGALKGDNIEKYRPGDNIIIIDPIAGPQNTYWDQIVWDTDTWDDSNTFAPLPDTVPIKTVQFHGTYALLEMSERQPSQTSEYGRLYRWLQLHDSDKGEES